MTLVNPLLLAQDLIRCPSVTPHEAGSLDVLEKALVALGFKVERVTFEDVENLYARRGSAGRNFCFAGHTDVVPTGDPMAWTSPPFAAEVRDGVLYGRGVVDMKGAIACFVAAVARMPELSESVSLLITGDEEGPALYGTTKMLDWLEARRERLDACLIGEPTSVERVGDMVKIGRRGSMNATLVVHGTQGHAAYPDKADNPIPRLLAALTALENTQLDDGFQGFQPSHLEIVSIDVGNPAFNVIPKTARATLNVRFNPTYTGETLEAKMREIVRLHAGAHTFEFSNSGDSFLSKPSPLHDLTVDAIRALTGIEAERSTSGGTSDARFIQKICPVIECGLRSATAHHVDEHAPVEDLETLTKIYEALLRGYFQGGAHG